MNSGLRIIAFCCNWCSYAAADLAGISRLHYPPSVRIIRVMCSGMVHPEMVLHALARGAHGVMIIGCHLGECHYIRGNEIALARAEVIAETLEDLGYEPERLVEAFRQMHERLLRLYGLVEPDPAATDGEVLP